MIREGGNILRGKSGSSREMGHCFDDGKASLRDREKETKENL